MTIPKITPYSGGVANPDGSQTQTEFTQNMFDQLSYEAELSTELNNTVDGINDTATQVDSDATSAAKSANDAEAAASGLNYQGLWPDTGGIAEKGDTYQTQVSGTGTGQYFTALQNTSADPVGDNVNWKVAGTIGQQNLSDYTDIVYKASGGNSAVENMIAGVPIAAKVGDIVSTGRGVFTPKVSPQTSINDFEIILYPSLYDFGAIGGDSSKDTAAFVAAFASGVPCEVPVVDISKAFIVEGVLELPRRTSLFGPSKSRVLNDINDTLTKQSYITFKDTSSHFGAGKGENDRVFLDWRNLTFVGNSGYDGKSGIAIGRNSGFPQNGAGGDMFGCTFNGFNEAWINDWAYFLDLDEVHLAHNNRGLTFRDWNSSSIRNLFGTDNTSYTADTSQGDPANSVFENVGINMLSDTKIGIRTGVGVRFDGQIYFESFGNVDAGNENRVDIALVVERFANRTIAVENVLFSISPGANYCMSIGGDQDLGPVNKEGTIVNCQFPPKAIAPIGFGVTDQFSGNPTFPNTTISNVESNFGLSYDSLRDAPNSPYAEYPVKNITTASISEPVTSSVNTFEGLNFVESDNTNPVAYNNRVGSINADGNFVFKRAGIYNVKLTVNLSTQNSVTKSIPELLLRAYGRTIDNQFKVMGSTRVGVNKDLDTMFLSGTVRATDGIVLEALYRSNSAIGEFSIDEAKMIVEYLGVGI